MASRAQFGLSLEEIGKLGVRKYLGDPRLGAAVFGPVGHLPGGYGGGVIHRIGDMRPAWDACRNIFFAAEAEMYATNGESGGEAWAPNGGDYGAWKALNFGTPPGVLTGRLRDQLTGASGDHYERSGTKYFEIGSDYPVSSGPGKATWPVFGQDHVWSTDSDAEDIGGLLAQGGSRYRKLDGTLSESVSARPPISITEGNIDQFVEAIMDYVTQAPLTRGWFNPHTRQWSGTFRRVTGFTQPPTAGTHWVAQPVQLIAGGGQTYRRTASGRRYKAKVT